MLKYSLANLDGVEDAFKGLYQQSEGGYTLNVDLANSGYEKVDGLKSALTKIKQERNDLKDRVGVLSKFESLLDVEGFDPSNVQELINKAANATDPEAIEKIQRQFEKQIQTLEKERDDFKVAAEQERVRTKDYIIKTEIMANAPKAGVLKEGVEDAYQLAKSHFSLDENNSVVVVDKDGDPTGKTPSEFFQQDFKEAKPWLYEAAKIKGSGSQPNQGQFKQSQDMTANEKIAAALSAKQ